MKNLMTAYIPETENMNPDGVISHLYDDPEFHVYADGRSLDLEQMKELVKRNWFKGIKKVEFHPDSMNIYVFGPDDAECYMTAMEILTDSADQAVRVAVEVSFHGRRMNDQMKIAYGHAYHRLVKQ